ncbi:MAG TPA: CoA pyrophosphatase [Dehalococcoidia bacterium]|nr:CoA pyrophosphatase [Dehalococcoidia bacterium]
MSDHSAPDLIARIRRILAEHKTVPVTEPKLVQAAVLVPVFDKGGEAHLLFTRRTHKVAHHRGEISFPGGMQDEADRTLVETALREAQEEIGLNPGDVELLGQLDQQSTYTTGFIISPFVARIPYPYPFQLDPCEIEELLEVPIGALRGRGIFRQEYRSFESGETRPVYFYTYRGHTIWGATARILKNFLELVFGPSWQEDNPLKNGVFQGD